MMTDAPRLFRLQRTQDVTGVSGPGHVADGVQFADGTVVMRWLGAYASTVVWDSLEAAMHVHGHDGTTRAVFGDEPTAMTDLDTAICAWLAEPTRKYADRYWSLNGAVDAVLTLHAPDSRGNCSECREGGSGYEAEPVKAPCPTVRTIAEGLGIKMETER
jgi:hypothetical protein